MLRFPHEAEENISRTARQWAGPEIAQRIRFTDVVSKEEHIERCGLADIFLDTLEVRCSVLLEYLSSHDCVIV